MFRISAYLQRHSESGIFYFRLTVPSHLRHAIGKREIKKSLNTGLRADAIPKVHQCYVEAHKLFQRAEKRMDTPRKKTEEATQAAEALADLDSMASIPDGFMGKITVSVAGQKVVIERDNPLEEVEEAARLLNLASSVPAAKTPPHKKDGSPPLSKMIKAYFTEVKLTGTQQPKTMEENQAIFQLLQETLRNPASSTIGFKLATDFKNILLRLPANRTKRKIRWPKCCRDRAHAPC